MSEKTGKIGALGNLTLDEFENLTAGKSYPPVQEKGGFYSTALISSISSKASVSPVASLEGSAGQSHGRNSIDNTGRPDTPYPWATPQL